MNNCIIGDCTWIVNANNLDTEACIASVAWETYIQHNAFLKPTIQPEYSVIRKEKRIYFKLALSQGKKRVTRTPGHVVMTRITTTVQAVPV